MFKKKVFLKQIPYKKKKISQNLLIRVFNKIIKKEKNLKNFNTQKKILYLLNEQEFIKKLDIFISSNRLPIEYKSFIKFRRQAFLLRLKFKKLKYYEKRKYFKKKKLNRHLKILLLNKYSLLNKIKFKKKFDFFIDKKKELKNLLIINIRANNIFINLCSYKQNELLFVKFWSCGLLNLHCTKRKLKFTIYTMLKEIKKQLKYLFFFIIKISCPKFLHKFLYRNFKKLFLRSTYLIFNSFKIFNGCRSKKKRRKKHLKFRIFR